MDGARFSYVKDADQYIVGVLRDMDIVDEYSRITNVERGSEYIMLGMRTTLGISAEEYHSVYRSDFAPLEAMLEKMQERGWARQRRGRWSFTPMGFLVSNQLIGILLDAQAEYKLHGNPWVREESSHN